MHGDGGQPAVVMTHHLETLYQRLTVMERGLALLSVVGDDHVKVMQGDILLGSSLHDTDAPIDIGRVAVALVVGCGDGKVGTGIEGLMADKHTLTEGLPGEVLWGRQTTMVEETAFAIDDVCIAVKHGRQAVAGGIQL